MLFNKKVSVAVQGRVNGREISKEFKNKARAMDYIDNILITNSLEVQEIITRTTSEEYYCNDSTRFIIYSI